MRAHGHSRELHPTPPHDTQGCPSPMALYLPDHCSLCCCMCGLHFFQVHLIQFNYAMQAGCQGQLISASQGLKGLYCDIWCLCSVSVRVSFQISNAT